jgi:hypothetical protein
MADQAAVQAVLALTRQVVDDAAHNITHVNHKLHKCPRKGQWDRREIHNVLPALCYMAPVTPAFLMPKIKQPSHYLDLTGG